MYFIFKKLLQSAQCINVGKLTYALNMYMDKRNQILKTELKSEEEQTWFLYNYQEAA